MIPETPRICAFFLVYIGIIPYVTALDTLVTDKENWNVGVAQFKTGNDDLSLLSAASTLGHLVQNELTRAKNHELSVVERYSIANKVIRTKELKHIDTLRGYHEKMDTLFFDLNVNPDEVFSLRGKISAERQILKETRKLSPLKIVVPSIMKINFSEAGNDSILWDTDGITPEVFRAINNLDLLISGEIVQVGEYYGIVAYAWTETGKKVLWERAVDIDSFTDIAQKIAQKALGIALGRPWSSLSVEVEPPTGLISVNGELQGVGSWSDGTLEPGDISLEISAHGYRPIVQKETILEGNHLDLLITLEKTEPRQVLVQTIPPGASARLGSLWKGLTPLPLTITDHILPLTFELEGYRNRTVPFSPDTERLTVPLEEDVFSPIKEMEAIRKKFDLSAALFSLSLAPTLFLMGLGENFLDMAETSVSPTDIQTANTSHTIATGFMWGSVAMNAVLLTITLVNLGKYLKSVEKLSE